MFEQRRRWYDGSSDPLDNAVDVGPSNQYEPDQEPDPLQPLRKVVAQHAEFACQDPEQIMIECETQDELLNLPKGSTLQLFIESISSTH